MDQTQSLPDSYSDLAGDLGFILGKLNKKIKELGVAVHTCNLDTWQGDHKFEARMAIKSRLLGVVMYSNANYWAPRSGCYLDLGGYSQRHQVM